MTPTESSKQPRAEYFIFDIESVADADLVSKVHYAGKVLPEEAVRKYRDELMATKGSDFIPYTFQMPVAVSVAKVTKEFEIFDLISLSEPKLARHEICKRFWQGWTAYNQPTLVSFNGRGFDIPLLEHTAFRYGISIPDWFAIATKSFDQPRNRYNTKAHLDLCDILTNFGATKINGGLNLLATLLGKPGKIDVEGNQVQDLYDQGGIDKISTYCQCDVLDTYFVFLRTMVLIGQIHLKDEQEIVRKAKSWIESRTDENEACRHYLNHWGDWQNPWEG